MRQHLAQQIEDEESEINITPMLDVVFIMLIFFIVTATFVKEAGIELSEYVVLGLGGVDRSRIHAIKTAAALNAIEPHFVRLRTLVPKINTLLLHQLKKGRFHPPN